MRETLLRQNREQTQTSIESKVLGLSCVDPWRKASLRKVLHSLIYCPISRYSPHLSVTYSHVTSDQSYGNSPFLWNCFSMALQFLEVFTVHLSPPPGSPPSLLSSLKRHIASNTVCRGTFSKQTTVFYLPETTLK
ncbi:hypothetical protein TNCV_1071431 [Trichonephila clavipes]|nr:hypothetical protein TNCV_1071431 [Trichonephila clavipes]